MAGWEIRAISAEETRLLRHKVLRPTQTPAELVFPGDDHHDSLHVGVFVDGRMEGIASVVPSPMAARPDQEAWQVRGMAVLPESRGKGLGTALLKVCISHVARHGSTLLWCRARTPAVPFYRRLGFETEGDEFLIPVSGPHFVMWRTVSPDEARDQWSEVPD
jgi:GNAT superfamily N-acetyltransferase